MAVKWFVERGLDMEARDEDGSTPLLLASKSGTVDVIEVLVELGADIGATDNNGMNVLDVAMNEENEELVMWLLDHGGS
jgi:ankyrin repeat protein